MGSALNITIEDIFNIDGDKLDFMANLLLQNWHGISPHLTTQLESPVSDFEEIVRCYPSSVGRNMHWQGNDLSDASLEVVCEWVAEKQLLLITQIVSGTNAGGKLCEQIYKRETHFIDAYDENNSEAKMRSYQRVVDIQFDWEAAAATESKAKAEIQAEKQAVTDTPEG